jgi:putative heme-binding domain-containing protein
MAPEASKSLDRLLSTSSGSLSLALALHENTLPDVVRKEAVERGAHSAQEAVRDLFEAFLPPEQLAGRLGPAINPADVLKPAGDAGRGRAIFFGTGGTAGLCSQCHQIGGQGQTFAPDLSHVATKYPDRAVLLEQVLEPSKIVDPKFATTVVQTNQGDLRVGILIDRTDKEVVLKDAQAKEWRILTTDVKRLATQPGSIMPEGLLSNLTAQQAADLLAFLHAQK